ncbi:hypothetical protein AAVH_02249 [Aphelenchoides avenae]|nr:hypothetical protein AAVH_02249 [Aphelenchus avenae]
MSVKAKSPFVPPSQRKTQEQSKSEDTGTQTVMKSVGFCATPRFLQRFGKDRKTMVSLSSPDFIQHLQEPPPCTLTGHHMPIVPIHGWRCLNNAMADRVLACGPTKDPVIHRGLVLGREILPAFPKKCPFSVLVLLAVPPLVHFSSSERELLEHLQFVVRKHYAGGDASEDLLNALQRLSELLNGTKQADAKAAVLAYLLKKGREPDVTKLVTQVGNCIELDKEQIYSIVDTLRAREHVTRENAKRLRQQFLDMIHERRDGKLSITEVQRAFEKLKHR